MKYVKIKAVKDFEPQFRLVSELQRLGERAFVFKLKQKRPEITPDEIAAEVGKWYLNERPNSSHRGRRLDTSRFNRK